MEVIPAIMPHSRSEMDAYAERFIGLVAAMQIDVMDGVFVPEKTWPYRDSFNAIRIEPLSRASEIAYEIDLMVDRPEDILGYWIQAGAKRVIVHIESTDSFIEILEHFGDVVNIGVAINIGTPVETLFEYLDNEYLNGNKINRNSCIEYITNKRWPKLNYHFWFNFESYLFHFIIINLLIVASDAVLKKFISLTGKINRVPVG